MQILYLDTTAGNWYDERGESFRSNQPNMAFQTQDELKIIAVTGTPEAETENINPAIDWPRDTQWSGMAARIAVDNDTIHRLKGTLSAEITAGSATSVAATVTSASQALIPVAGTITLYDTEGSFESVPYASRLITGTAVVFSLADGATVANSYHAGAVMDCPQSPYCSALMNPDKSNPIAGEFSFDLVVDSRRLREEMLYTSKDRLPVKGMELLFYREDETGSVPVRAFLLSTFSIVGLLNDVNGGADLLEDDTVDRLNSLVYSVLSAGEEVQYSADGITWLSPEEATDPGTVKYFRSRNRKTKGEWSDPIPVVQGPQGKAGTITIGKVTSGDSASVENVGTPENAVLDFTLPKGDKGEKGTAATLSIGTVTTGLPGTAATVENVGDDNAAVLNFTIPRGSAFKVDATGLLADRSQYDSELEGFSYLATDNGNVYIRQDSGWSDPIPFKGDPGKDGENATITIGEVTTGNAGTEATVENVGTDSAAVLNFNIPKGDPGEPLEANFVDVTEAADGYLVIPDLTIPVSVEINGIVYAIDDGLIEHSADTFKIPVAPFLAMANLAEFSGTWRVWRAGGKQGIDGVPGQTGGTFTIQVVSELPENPDPLTLYLVTMGE